MTWALTGLGVDKDCRCCPHNDPYNPGMWRIFLLLVFCCCLLAGLGRAEAQVLGNKGLAWPLQTIETPHFRLLHPPRLEAFARKVAAVAEYVREQVVGSLGNDPGLTWILVNDETDLFNGFALPGPYPLIRVYATFPRPTDIGAQWQDAMLALVSHELTHVAHLTSRDAGRRYWRKLLGEVPGLTSARIPPPWFVEGLAVLLETRLTSGGRSQDASVASLRAQIMREGQWPDLRQISLGPIESWPQGNTRYQFGAGFVAFLAQTVGDAGLRAAIAAYNGGTFISDWAEAWQAGTQTDLYDLWQKWTALEQKRANDELLALQASALPPGERIKGSNIPAFDGTGERLAFWDGQLRLQNRAGQDLFAPSRLASRPQRLSWPRNQPATGVALVYSRFVTSGMQTVGEVFRFEHGQEQQLTHNAHARDAVAWADCIAYVRDVLDQSSLRQVCEKDGQWADSLLFMPPEGWHLAYPVVAASGEMAFSVWRPGGFLDIARLKQGQLTFVTSDRAQDLWPSFDENGRLYWISDRGGSFQLYREGAVIGQPSNQPSNQPSGKQLEQLTAFAGGVYGHTIFGQTLIATSFGGNGPELRQAHLEQAITSTSSDTVPVPLVFDGSSYPVTPYNPTANALYWLPITDNGLGLSLTGADAAGLQQWNVQIGHAFTGDEALFAPLPSFSASYSLAPSLDYLIAGKLSIGSDGWSASAGPLWAGSQELWGGNARWSLGASTVIGTAVGGNYGDLRVFGRLSNQSSDIFGYPSSGWRVAASLASLSGVATNAALAYALPLGASTLPLGLEFQSTINGQRLNLQAEFSTRFSIRTNWRVGDGIYSLERITLRPLVSVDLTTSDNTSRSGSKLAVQFLGDFALSYYAPASFGLEVSYRPGQSAFGLRFLTFLPILDDLSATR
jgi:hypothetical protein